MDPRRTDMDLLVVLIAMLAIDGDDDDDGHLRHLLHRRLRSSEQWSPELRELIDELLMRPRSLGTWRSGRMREIALAVLDGYRGGVEERLGRVEQRVAALEAGSDLARQASDAQRDRTTLVEADLHSYLWLASTGADLTQVEMTRFVPLRLFVGDPVPDADALESLVRAFLALVEPVGLKLSEDLPPESGSWWKRLVLRTKAWMKQPEVQDVTDKAKAALELQYLDKPQAEANKLQAEGAAQVINALAAISGPCAAQLGTLLVIKTDGADGRPSIVARTLSAMEVRRLEENRSMLGRPCDLLPWLASAGPDGRGTTDIMPR